MSKPTNSSPKRQADRKRETTIQFVLYIFEVVLSSYPILVNSIAWWRHEVEIQDWSEPFLISSFIIMSYTTLILITTFSRERETFTMDAWAFFIWGSTFLYDVTLAILLLSNKIQTYGRNTVPVILFVVTVFLAALFRFGYIWRDGRHTPTTELHSAASAGGTTDAPQPLTPPAR
jgi:hypothetical protein